MNELAYHRHWETDAKARELYHELRELYGNKMTRSMLFAKAYIDRVITIEERCILQDFITSDNM